METNYFLVFYIGQTHDNNIVYGNEAISVNEPYINLDETIKEIDEENNFRGINITNIIKLTEAEFQEFVRVGCY